MYDLMKPFCYMYPYFTNEWNFHVSECPSALVSQVPWVHQQPGKCNSPRATSHQTSSVLSSPPVVSCIPELGVPPSGRSIGQTSISVVDCEILLHREFSMLLFNTTFIKWIVALKKRKEMKN